MTEREIKANLNRVVAHGPSGMKYRLTGATIRPGKDGGYWYQAELQDLRAERSVRICRLEDVAVLEEPREGK